ncbi:hypothetical protein V8C44DRAFT_333700 [Trichoderma aethiopicum]
MRIRAIGAASEDEENGLTSRACCLCLCLCWQAKDQYMYSRHHLPTHTHPRGSKRNGEAGRGEMQASRPRLWERRRENVAEQTREADTAQSRGSGWDLTRSSGSTFSSATLAGTWTWDCDPRGCGCGTWMDVLVPELVTRGAQLRLKSMLVALEV